MACLCRRCKRYVLDKCSERCSKKDVSILSITDAEIQNSNYDCFEEKIYRVRSGKVNSFDITLGQLYGSEIVDSELKRIAKHLVWKEEIIKNNKIKDEQKKLVKAQVATEK